MMNIFLIPNSFNIMYNHEMVQPNIGFKNKKGTTQINFEILWSQSKMNKK